MISNFKEQLEQGLALTVGLKQCLRPSLTKANNLRPITHPKGRGTPYPRVLQIVRLVGGGDAVKIGRRLLRALDRGVRQ